MVSTTGTMTANKREVTMDKDEAVLLLRQAIWRIDTRMENDSGKGWRCGEAFDRLARVLKQYLEPQLDEQEGKEEADKVRRKHGVIAPYKG